MTASAFSPRPLHRLRARGLEIELGIRTQVMAVLNATPDSFSDGGRHATVDRAVVRLEAIWEEGADWVDIGGESTRPGAAAVSSDEEWSRVGPILEAAFRRGFPLPVSVDTTKSVVAERALALGAVMVNDVSALRFDPRIADLVAESGAALILMHMRGDPRTMQLDTAYPDLLCEIQDSLGASVETARARGVSDQQIVLDPGLGFGKATDQNLEVLASVPELASLGFPVAVGASRKSFLGRILGLSPERRVAASVAAHVAAVLAGAHFVRVHDVRPTVEAVRVADEILRVGRTSETADS